MAPIVYERRRMADEDVDCNDVDDRSTEPSSPSFQLMSPPTSHTLSGKDVGMRATVGDSSYDTSVASILPWKETQRDGGLETDIDSEPDDVAAPTTLASRMQPKSLATSSLFLFSEDEDEEGPGRKALSAKQASQVDARKARMQRLRMLAQQRTSLDEETREPPRSPSPPSETSRPSSPLAAPALVDIVSDDDDDNIAIPAPSSKPVKGLSNKEKREMHSMSARLRREHRTSLPRPEPKRYQLSELLSTIQHTTSPAPQAMHSSDPVESSSTPDPRPPSDQVSSAVPTSPSERRRPIPDDDEARQLAQKKWAWIRRQPAPPSSKDGDDDDELEVVDVRSHHAPHVRFRGSPPRDVQRDEVASTLAHLAVRPRTPRRHRIATNEYRSPNAHGPTADPVSDAQMDVAAHTFALAAHRDAGHMAPTSPGQPDKPTQRPSMPPVLGLGELNATVLQKVYAQNAASTAKRAPPTQVPHPRASPSPSPPPDPQQAPASSQAYSPASSLGSGSSEKENEPLRSRSASLSDSHPRAASPSPSAPLSELPIPDLGDFFAPTPTDRSVQPSPSPAASLSRTGSNSSVLAQFFEAGTQEPSRNASLDIFANERRSGPVGGMTQFFDATPVDPVSRSQEAMPPPTHAPSGDAFAALRRAEQADAAAPLSPDVLPSLDPSLAERGEDLWREAQAAQQQSHDGMLYLNEDGFFTQTKPQEPPSPGSVHEDSDADEPAPAPAVRHTYKRPTSAFVFGEAEESDEDEQRGDHGGLAGVFSDKGSDSEKEEGSEDDADLSSLLDDESDSDNDEKDEAARKMFMQHQQEDDAAAQALHERATKGLLRHRRRGREDDMLADMLDEDADEDELRRRLQAPRFAKSKRRQVEGDGLDALAAREDAQAFVRTYTETHTTADDHAKYDFLHADDSSSEDEERVSAHTIRTEILRASRQRAASPDLLDPTHSDHDEIGVKLSSRAAPKRAATTMSDDEDAHYSKVLFTSGKVDVSSLSRDAQEKRARLLEEYSHEPAWQDGRGGRGGIDRRRSGSAKRSSSMPLSRSFEPTQSAPSVLVHRVLKRQAQFP
ncbi:mitotic G2 DNA damage checkpoint signaling protein [Malassezia pachydermatis]|uniref:DNA replication checkpoint mediator MRC1 domain-containing protein n=1 Tax=Malassezia pachydermatis TaxID=77020 RepID=A0A0M8MVS3_9BASI|nr:hypothetical protein Malapachy_2460 [Malassezia pachydermatis]KOS15314.1 hypothetical protein Malapachy_2460 [Malassezia pachydermatis]